MPTTLQDALLQEDSDSVVLRMGSKTEFITSTQLTAMLLVGRPLLEQQGPN